MPHAFRTCTLFTWLCLHAALSPALAQEPPELKRTLDELSQAIKQAGYVRVGVAPSFSTSDGLPGSQPIVTSPHGLYFASVVQAGLVARRGDTYQVVDADVLATAFRNAGIESVQDLDRLRQLADRIGGLDALVVGKQQWDVLDETVEDDRRTLQVECKLLEIGTGNVQADKRARRTLTLADEIYAGESIEVLRPTNAGFLPLGVSGSFAMNRNMPIPLSPRASATHFGFFQPHPLPNPNCPYRVTVCVNDETRPFVYHPRLDDVYVPIEPGEQYSVHVENTLDRDVRVALWVDGLNIRGKRRELPDEQCSAWTLAAGRTGRFRGFYDETTPTATVGPFTMVPVEDSVAMQEGFTEHLGQITVVIFNSGWPRQQDIVRRSTRQRSYTYHVGRSWNADRQNWEYREGWATIAGAAPGLPRFGTGEGERVPVRLTYRGIVRGPVLAAMTIRYTTRSEIDRLLSQDQ